MQLNRVIRGIANYFCTDNATIRIMVENFDNWIRMPLRCMKFKSKNQTHNRKFKLKHFRTLGLLSLRDSCYWTCQRTSQQLLKWSNPFGGLVRARCTFGNRGN